MTWIEKRPKGPDANLKPDGGRWLVCVRLRLPNGETFRRELSAGSKTAARRVRDDVYAAYNALALDSLAGKPERPHASPEGMTLLELAERCRDEWWLARGRSPEVAEQYFQKLRDYAFPALGETCPIATITPESWDRVFASLSCRMSARGTPLATETVRKVKAVLSSALSCAVAHKRLNANPIKGLAFSPHPLAEADRLGIPVEAMAEEDAPARRVLTDEEAGAILDAARGTPVYPLAVLQLGFGLRIAEALAVRWGDLDPETGELRVRRQVRRRRNPAWKEAGGVPKTVLQGVPVLKTKAGRREIPALPDALALLATLERGADGETLVRTEGGGLVEPRNAQRAFRALVDALVERGVIASPRPTTHSMRSWRLSHFANVVGLPASHLMRVAGHTNVETTMRFYVSSERESLNRWLSERADAPGRSPLVASPPPPRARAGSGPPPRRG